MFPSAPSLVSLGPAIKWKTPRDVINRGPGDGAAHSRVIADIRMSPHETGSRVSINVSVPYISDMIPELSVGHHTNRDSATRMLHTIMARTCGTISTFVEENTDQWIQGPIDGLNDNGGIAEEIRISTHFDGVSREAWGALQIHIATWLQTITCIDQLSITAMRQERDSMRLELEWYTRAHARRTQKLLRSVVFPPGVPGLSKLPR
jgi:hypothetical protein